MISRRYFLKNYDICSILRYVCTILLYFALVMKTVKWCMTNEGSLRKPPKTWDRLKRRDSAKNWISYPIPYWYPVSISYPSSYPMSLQFRINYPRWLPQGPFIGHASRHCFHEYSKLDQNRARSCNTRVPNLMKYTFGIMF